MFAVYNAVLRIINPTEINYNGMIVFAIVGVCVNFGAAILTRDGDSLNQKAVNLHMLEDVLGWIVVLVGAIVMRFTDFYIIDPLMSIGVAIFILINALNNLKDVLDLFLEKTPHGISTDEIAEHICEVEGVLGVHHIHVWSIEHPNYDIDEMIIVEHDKNLPENYVADLCTPEISFTSKGVAITGANANNLAAAVINKSAPTSGNGQFPGATISGGAPYEVIFDFGKEVSFAGAKIYRSSSNAGYTSPKTAYISISDDGKNWINSDTTVAIKMFP